MARFDIYPNPVGAGYLLDIQADLLSGLNTRVVVPGRAPRFVHFHRLKSYFEFVRHLLSLALTLSRGLTNSSLLPAAHFLVDTSMSSGQLGCRGSKAWLALGRHALCGRVLRIGVDACGHGLPVVGIRNPSFLYLDRSSANRSFASFRTCLCDTFPVCLPFSRTCWLTLLLCMLAFRRQAHRGLLPM